jgi:son of sevenless-like protein
MSSTSTASLPQYQEVALSQNRERAGSLPTRSRSFKQRSITVDEPHQSKPREPGDVSEIARLATNGLSDGLVKRSRSQKLKQAMGFADNCSQPAVESQPIIPWALQNAYPDQVQTDSNGNIWGTLDALVDKLLTDAPPRDPIRESIHRIPQGIINRTYL